MGDQETKVCVSIAEKDGNFGVTFHNAEYNFLGLNFKYESIKLSPHQLPDFMERMIKGFHGCSVSMPHKREAIRSSVNIMEKDVLMVGAGGAARAVAWQSKILEED